MSTRRIFDASTGEERIIEMAAEEELLFRSTRQRDPIIKKNEEIAKKERRNAILKKIGLSEEELKDLIG